MKLTFPDVAIILYLVLSIENIRKLLSVDEAWATAIAFAVVGTMLSAGYVLTARFQEARRVEQIIKTDIAQSAIAAMSQNPGYDHKQAEKTVRALCANISEDNAEVLLKAIASQCVGKL
ncbi:MAG: hypothetical protein HWQ38_24090 [Nostoc sp. NMS7]|uniref:hypothetical protein n=1 Tax=Nostoc sp. NMS7 TaxID=2815391 RepID=UPI0025D990AB|nr:hypothetical protein [Nostoc sp. NMS7]MBN3949374.1 hypothetical protein [Nostoc sp. NMS7]